MANQRNNNESAFDRDVGFRRQHVPLLFAPIALFLVVTFVIPTDLFSTARWWDMQGWALVWDGTPNSVVGVLNDMIPGPASAEAVVFSAMMILFQFVVTYKIYEEGSWLLNNSNIGLFPLLWKLLKSREKFENVNPSKFAWLMVWIGCVCFDAYTAYSYRTSTGAAALTTLIVHSIFAENVLSEIMMGETLRMTINLIAIILATGPGAADRAGEYVSGLKNRKDKDKKKGPGPSGQQQGRPQGQQQGGQPQHRPQGQQQQGRPQGQQQGGRPQGVQPTLATLPIPTYDNE